MRRRNQSISGLGNQKRSRTLFIALEFAINNDIIRFHWSKTPVLSHSSLPPIRIVEITVNRFSVGLTGLVTVSVCPSEREETPPGEVQTSKNSQSQCSMIQLSRVYGSVHREQHFYESRLFHWLTLQVQYCQFLRERPIVARNVILRSCNK